MAKKKLKAHHKKQSSVGWIIAIVVIIVIVALLVSRNKEAAPTAVTTQKEAAPEKEAWTSSVAPEFNKACKSVAIGVIPGSKSVSDNNVMTFDLKNNGRVPIEGTYFEFSDGIKKVYRKNTDAIKVSEKLNYKVSLDDVAKELGAAVAKFTVYPVQASKACANAAVSVVK